MADTGFINAAFTAGYRTDRVPIMKRYKTGTKSDLAVIWALQIGSIATPAKVTPSASFVRSIPFP